MMTYTPTWGIYYWPWGLALMSIVFFPAELFALFTNVNNTLSDYCWKELHVGLAYSASPHSIAWWTSLCAWILFVIVITGHIWWKAY